MFHEEERNTAPNELLPVSVTKVVSVQLQFRSEQPVDRSITCIHKLDGVHVNYWFVLNIQGLGARVCELHALMVALTKMDWGLGRCTSFAKDCIIS